MRKRIANTVLVAALLAGCGIFPSVSLANARLHTHAPARTPIVLDGTIYVTLIGAKTTSNVKVNGVTLTTQYSTWKFSGLLTGIDYDNLYTNVYPDGTVLGAGTDVCVCTAQGLSGTTTDQFTFTDDGKNIGAPGTFGPGTGGFAGLTGTGFAIQSDKDPNHFKIIVAAQVP